MSKKNYGILVTTKDRELYLAAFLESVSKLHEKPEQIVIVSTGKEIEQLIDKYSLVLNIDHLHSEKGGQTFQKKLGINLINPTLEWVLFCDDDILLFPDTITELFSFEEVADESNNIFGVGLMDLSNKIIEYRRIEKIGRALFKLRDSAPGKVLKNGYNSNYMNSPHSIRTEWLNGVALWRKHVVLKYAVNLDSVKHAYGEDLIFFIRALNNIYTKKGGMEALFKMHQGERSLLPAIVQFHNIFFEPEHYKRSEKHVANPDKGSVAKRINLFLRWMIRKDRIVDFGLWDIPTSKLHCPLDIHSGNIARKLGLITRKNNDLAALEELDSNLRALDAQDPVKYDFALFGLGIFDKFCI
jgi:uncharacterized protein (TIGR02757 family)